MEKMRLFIGLFPSDEALSSIRDVMRQMDKIKRNFKYIPYDQMHLTVKFVGSSVSKESYDIISQHFSSFCNTLKGTEVVVESVTFGFKGQSRPNVIFFNIAPSKELDQLTRAISEEIKNLKLDDTIKKLDRKKLTHHITIARSKRHVSGSLVKSTRETLKRIKIPEIKFKAENVTLVASELSKTGPVYKKLAQYKLNS